MLFPERDVDGGSRGRIVRGWQMQSAPNDDRDADCYYSIALSWTSGEGVKRSIALRSDAGGFEYSSRFEDSEFTVKITDLNITVLQSSWLDVERDSLWWRLWGMGGVFYDDDDPYRGSHW